jgi:glycosyltransferase involved in cell wall biosynthesis
LVLTDQTGRPDTPIVVALISTRNDAEFVAAAVSSTLSIPSITRVIVADDNSEDDTVRVAEKAGAKVLRLRNRLSSASNPDIPNEKPVINLIGNKGSALEFAIKFAEDADIILLLDGGLGSSAGEAEKLLIPVLHHEADMTIAKPASSAGKTNGEWVQGLARWGIAALGGGWQAEAPLSGQRCIRSTCLEKIRPFAHGHGVEVALTVRALRAGMRVLEVSTTMERAPISRKHAGIWQRSRRFLNVLSALLRLKTEGS